MNKMKNLPKVTVAMAVYKPDLDFFRQQLESINEQDYGNVSLLIWNDSPREFQCEEIVSQHITKIPYRILDNGHNNGVTQAFAHLTEVADGKYIAYCDQDDIWLKNKISITVAFMENHPECSCCHCECQLIDEQNHVVKEHLYPAEMDILNNIEYQKRSFFVKNWSLGCAMTLPTTVAKAALPFPDMIFHDQWIEMFALTKGNFYYLQNMLLQHRVHGTNNSETLHGIKTKADYYQLKLNKEIRLYTFLKSRLTYWREYEKEGMWIKARENYAKHPRVRTFLHLCQFIKVRPGVTLFELIMPLIPEWMFSRTLNFIREEVRKFGIR
jgi:glycosyltransferase involved in cell wall biosynthesis